MHRPSAGTGEIRHFSAAMYLRVYFSSLRVGIIMMVIVAAIGQPPTNSANKK